MVSWQMHRHLRRLYVPVGLQATLIRRSCLQQFNYCNAQWFSKILSTKCISSSSNSRHQYLSLYNYVTIDKEKLGLLRHEMLEKWNKLEILGRIYISFEGINAQLILPERNVDAFVDSFPKLFNREHLNYGALIKEDEDFKVPDLFHKLHVRIRRQIVHDGFDQFPLDVKNSGLSLAPKDWHQQLLERNEKNTKDDVLVLDVRNFYEHEIGRFDGATRIMVDTFKDTFDALDNILEEHEVKHSQKPKEILMYCTGGIRCEKVGAYLKQAKGIDQVKKLQGGIVHYMKFLQENPEKQSLFKGKNFAFDQRCVAAGLEIEEVTKDVLSRCFQCGEPCNNHKNCRNEMCGGLMLQCDTCHGKYLGTCSEKCHQVFLQLNEMKEVERREYRKQHAHEYKPTVPNALARYLKHIKIRPVPKDYQYQITKTLSTCHSVDPNFKEMKKIWNEKAQDNVLLANYLIQNSNVHALNEEEELIERIRQETIKNSSKPEQMVDALQGKLLTFLVQSIQAKEILEIGCFTGVSTLCLANGLDIGVSHGKVTTCDINQETMDIASEFFKQSQYKNQIEPIVADGMDLLKKFKQEKKKIDLIFIDANKKQYLAYYDQILEARLLRPNGLMVFDNTLFRGRVLAAARGNTDPKEKLAKSLDLFNQTIAKDPRTRQVMLPLWDGITLVSLASSDTL
jgi:UPF0176 protein